MNRCEYIISFTYEILMGLFDMATDIEIARTMLASVTFASHPESHAIVYASRYFNSLLYFFLYSSLPMTFFTRVFYFDSFSVTFITENCLLHESKYTSCCPCYVPRAMTCATFFWFFSIFCSMSFAALTVDHFIKMNFFFYA